MRRRPDLRPAVRWRVGLRVALAALEQCRTRTEPRTEPCGACSDLACSFGEDDQCRAALAIAPLGPLVART